MDNITTATGANKIGKCDSCYWSHITDNEIVCRYNDSNRNIVGVTKNCSAYFSVGDVDKMVAEKVMKNLPSVEQGSSTTKKFYASEWKTGKPWNFRITETPVDSESVKTNKVYADAFSGWVYGNSIEELEKYMYDYLKVCLIGYERELLDLNSSIEECRYRMNELYNVINAEIK